LSCGWIFSGASYVVAPDAGPDLLSFGRSHTFFGLSEAISQGFGRWDLSHLQELEVASGQRIGFVDEDWRFDDEQVWDHAQVKVASVVGLDRQARRVLVSVKPGAWRQLWVRRTRRIAAWLVRSGRAGVPASG
jgi:hypothetical protein